MSDVIAVKLLQIAADGSCRNARAEQVCVSAAAKIERLKEERDKYREAAEIFRDFGVFDNAHHDYDKKQLARARWTMTGDR